MKKIFFAIIALLLFAGVSVAQLQSEKKHYPPGKTAGDVALLEEWVEGNGNQSSSVYVVEVKSPGRYFIKINTNMQEGARQWVTADGVATSLTLAAQKEGWQQLDAAIHGGAEPSVFLSLGRHTLRFISKGDISPNIEAISLCRSRVHKNLDDEWQKLSGVINRLSADIPVSTEPLDKNNPAETSKVLSNPEGNYEHAIDVGFTHSTMVWVFLTAGNVYTFETFSSTKDPVLNLFDPINLPAKSWSDDDSGPGYESKLVVTAPSTGTYGLLVRPFWNGEAGITSIKKNGVNLVTSTGMGGYRYNTSVRTGDLNYFTARLSGTSPDTRIYTVNSASGTVTGYNDDYFNSSDGTWDWGLGSRIKKNYTAGTPLVFVCSFGLTTTGTCDVYMGNKDGQLHNTEPGNFPLLANEDAIQSAPSSGSYNCAAWSGGVTSTWIWPPNELSTYNCPSNNILLCFDNYYNNSPVRYPGAWNYTRTGATAANAAVDVWKQPNGGPFEHASVTKPGNDHPHGYDWESKPGGLDRQFHPRNALANDNWYGQIAYHYKATGTFAKMAGANRSFETDADAVAAGIAIFENAKLTTQSQEKLNRLLLQTDRELTTAFERLYNDWKKTWALNLSKSDPDEYCRNREFEMLEAWSMRHNREAMIAVFDKFTNGDHFITKLLLDLTRGRYIKLLDEAKRDILMKPYDDKGRYIVHGDHDNGVRYIEKILQQLDERDATPAVAPGFTFKVNASPNPVKDLLSVTVEVKTKGRISVQAVSSQTGITKVIAADKEVIPGTYQYQLNIKGITGTTGDLLMVKVKVNGEEQVIKVLVAN